MRHLQYLATCVTLAALTGCATPPPLTAESQAVADAREAYRLCSWGHLRPLLVASPADSSESLARVAESQCRAQWAALRDAVELENKDNRQGPAYAASFALESRRNIVAAMAGAAVRQTLSPTSGNERTREGPRGALSDQLEMTPRASSASRCRLLQVSAQAAAVHSRLNLVHSSQVHSSDPGAAALASARASMVDADHTQSKCALSSGLRPRLRLVVLMVVAVRIMRCS